MEGIKHTFSANIDEHGTLRMNMVEFRSAMNKYRNKKAIVTVEVLDGGDCQMMLAMYRNNWLPKIVAAWREHGENYTAEQADIELVKHTTTRRKTVLDEDWVIPLEELDRELLKNWMDEVARFSAENLSLII